MYEQSPFIRMHNQRIKQQTQKSQKIQLELETNKDQKNSNQINHINYLHPPKNQQFNKSIHRKNQINSYHSIDNIYRQKQIEQSSLFENTHLPQNIINNIKNTKNIQQTLININLDDTPQIYLQKQKQKQPQPKQSSGSVSYSSYTSRSNTLNSYINSQYIDKMLTLGPQVKSSIKDQSQIIKSIIKKPFQFIEQNLSQNINNNNKISQAIIPNKQNLSQKQKNNQNKQQIKIIQNKNQSKQKTIQKIKNIKSNNNHISLENKKQRPLSKNLKDYLKIEENYQNQVQKMIDKFQKLSQLKQKTQSIQIQLQKLNQPNQQNLQNNKDKIFNIYHQNSIKRDFNNNNHINKNNLSKRQFKQKQPQYNQFNNIQDQIEKDTNDIQNFIEKFKTIKKSISVDNIDLKNIQFERSQRNFKQINNITPIIFNSQKMTHQSIKINNQTLPQNMTQKIQNQYSYQNQPIKSYKNSQYSKTIPFNITDRIDQIRQDNKIAQKNISNKNINKIQKKQINNCQCNRLEILQQIRKLNQKIQRLSSEKLKEQKKQLFIDNFLQDNHQFDQWSGQESSNNNFINNKNIKKISPSTKNIRNAVSSDLPITQAKSPKPPALQKQPIPTKRNIPLSPKIHRKSSSLKRKKFQNNFSEEINQKQLILNFPKFDFYINQISSQNTSIKFAENIYRQLFDYIKKQKNLNNFKIPQFNIKIKKYQQFIHFYTLNVFNYHLIYYFKGKIYFGEWKNSNQGGYKHGYGYYFNKNKYIYQGQFSCDKKNGKGIINYENGQLYSGYWVNNKKEGKGILVNPSKDIYLGFFSNGKKNGFGEEKLSNGDFYKGQFKEGKLNGFGTYWWFDGSTYKGQFYDGLLHGKGIWKSKQNDCYQGEYRFNKKYGQGTYTWSNGIIFSGNFKDQRNGKHANHIFMKGKKSKSKQKYHDNSLKKINSRK